MKTLHCTIFIISVFLSTSCHLLRNKEPYSREGNAIHVKSTTFDTCMVSGHPNSIHVEIENLSNDTLLIPYYFLAHFDVTNTDSSRISREALYEPAIHDDQWNESTSINPKSALTINLRTNSFLPFRKLNSNHALLYFGNIVYFKKEDKKFKYPITQKRKEVYKVIVCNN
ncbi:MAG: hypothetical protein RLZZ262_357 [Bacteroidota bacterium]|jgi:hypothetical protein